MNALAKKAATELLDKLSTDKATGWKDFFGDQLPLLCERICDELDNLGYIGRETKSGNHGPDAAYEGAVTVIFEDSILVKSIDRKTRLNWLRNIELGCREAREALDMPATSLNL